LTEMAMSFNPNPGEGRKIPPCLLPHIARHPSPTLYVANQGVTIMLRFGGKAVPT
jgi:hypothetical protein